MKNTIKLAILFIIGIHLVSCQDNFSNFLDKAPGVDVTEDTIFTSKVQVETFIAGTYQSGIPNYFPFSTGAAGVIIGNGCMTINSSLTDESTMGDVFFHNKAWNFATLTANGIQSNEDRRFNTRWQAIRKCNILIERINSVTNPTVDQTYKDQIMGEAKFIRAINYFEFFKRYGGIPIVAKRFQITDDMKVPRSSIEDLVNFIVKDCDDAITLLPNTYAATMRGRATKGAAMALKSRTLLYAASPLFNTVTPYIDFGENNKLICYGNYDKNRWQLAADASKVLIDWAAQNGVYLVENQGVTKNYQYVWEVPDNSEIILAEKKTKNKGYWDWPWIGLRPRQMNLGWGGVSPLQNFVKLYERKDGTPQTWDINGGNNLNQKYAELDYRFAQTIGANGSYWSPDDPIIQTWQEDPTNGITAGLHTANCAGGTWMHKLIPTSLTNANYNATPNGIVFRLAEAFLNYAEALNEANGGPTTDAYNAVNTIRARSGQPNLPTGLSQDEFRIRVRNERAIELAFEDHRFWDIRRWKIAENEGVMQGQMWGIKVYKIPNSTEFRYVPYVIETRIFLPKMYLHPFLPYEVYKGYLVQNPGWL